MTNSTKADPVSEIIDGIIDLINEERVQELCEEPISQVLAEFEYDPEIKVDHPHFLETVGKFIHHIHASAMHPRQRLNPDQAKAEAIRLLQTDYQGNAGSGLAGAYLDAIDPAYDGLGFVLKQIAAVLIDRARQNHLRWVFSSRLNALRWSTRRAVAAELLRRWDQSSPGTAPNVKPAQAAGHCAGLLTALVSAENQVSEIFSSQRNLTNT